MPSDQLSFGRWAKSEDTGDSRKAAVSPSGQTDIVGDKPAAIETSKPTGSPGTAVLHGSSSDLRPPSAFATQSQTGFDGEATDRDHNVAVVPLATEVVYF